MREILPNLNLSSAHIRSRAESRSRRRRRPRHRGLLSAVWVVWKPAHALVTKTHWLVLYVVLDQKRASLHAVVVAFALGFFVSLPQDAIALGMLRRKCSVKTGHYRRKNKTGVPTLSSPRTPGQPSPRTAQGTRYSVLHRWEWHDDAKSHGPKVLRV
jgi:hypothetical protein